MKERAFNRARRAMLASSLAAGLVLSTAMPAAAGQSEWGTAGCGALVAYVHARYNDVADILPPGKSTWHRWRENDGLWHIHEHNGFNSGYWTVDAIPWVDFPGTWTGCRNFG